MPTPAPVPASSSPNLLDDAAYLLVDRRSYHSQHHYDQMIEWLNNLGVYDVHSQLQYLKPNDWRDSIWLTCLKPVVARQVLKCFEEYAGSKDD